MTHRTRILGTALCAFACTTLAATAQLQVRGVIGAGGAAAVAGTTVVAGTVGQALIGPTTGLGTTAWQGFWYTIDTAPIAGLEDNAATNDATAALLCSPNPCAAQTTFRIHLTRGGSVRLSLFDALGRHVRTLANGEYEAGSHNVPVSTSELQSGNYVARLEAPGTNHAIRVMVVK